MKYFLYLIKHKWYVFIECCKVGIWWRGILHDLSCFLPSAFILSVKYWIGKPGHSYNSKAFNDFRIDMLNGRKNQICANCDQLKAGMPVNLDPYKEELLERF